MYKILILVYRHFYFSVLSIVLFLIYDHAPSVYFVWFLVVSFATARKEYWTEPCPEKRET